MAGFDIRQCNPVEYKGQIIDFWNKYLPGTETGRFDWLNSNPSGETIWLLAFDKDSDDLVGTISIMKHDLSVDGELKTAGILGDLMISEKCRVFGPALPLLKAAIGAKTANGLDFLYTVPNPASMKLTERVGFTSRVILKHFVRPVASFSYINKKVGSKLLSRVVGFFLDRFMYICSAVKSRTSQYDYVVYDTIDENYQELFDSYFEPAKKMIASFRGPEFLKWRYTNNPKYKFRFMVATDNKSGKPQGYIAFCISENKMLVYDMFAGENKLYSHMINRLLRLASEEKCQSVYSSVSSSSEFPSILKSSLFIDANADVSVLMYEDSTNIQFDKWSMLEGDRNI